MSFHSLEGGDPVKYGMNRSHSKQSKPTTWLTGVNFVGFERRVLKCLGKEIGIMQQRHALIDAWLSREFSISHLSRRFGVSRKTIYKWISRYDQYGRNGLDDLSRAPHHQAHQTDDDIVKQIIDLKHRHLDWGPVTLHDYLVREHGDRAWPVASTFGRILKDAGLVRSRGRRHRTPRHSQPLQHATHPNAVWSADFKGQFSMGNGRLCYPLTLSDNHSRYILACQGLYGIKLEGVKPVYERLFQQWGLPDAIRTDNGYPFAQVCLGGLTKLSIWLLRLGILPERIKPGCPDQNGRHERMHRTLKARTASPPAYNLSAQQRAFNRFTTEYNYVRPHRSLGGQSPGHCYTPSIRPYPDKLPEVIYDDAYWVRKVKCGGQIKLNGQPIYISRQLIGEYVGLKPMGYERWQLYFCQLPLGMIDERVGTVTRPS